MGLPNSRPTPCCIMQVYEYKINSHPYPDSYSYSHSPKQNKNPLSRRERGKGAWASSSRHIRFANQLFPFCSVLPRTNDCDRTRRPISAGHNSNQSSSFFGNYVFRSLHHDGEHTFRDGITQSKCPFLQISNFDERLSVKLYFRPATTTKFWSRHSEYFGRELLDAVAERPAHPMVHSSKIFPLMPLHRPLLRLRNEKGHHTAYHNRQQTYDDAFPHGVILTLSTASGSFNSLQPFEFCTLHS
jgi:hypothetical protein